MQGDDSPLQGSKGNIKMQNQYRVTGGLPRTKNYMLRTTLGLKDETSSDTVSTEFNYLQPTVRKLDVNQRASLGTSQNLAMIHV